MYGKRAQCVNQVLLFSTGNSDSKFVILQKNNDNATHLKKNVGMCLLEKLIIRPRFTEDEFFRWILQKCFSDTVH